MAQLHINLSKLKYNALMLQRLLSERGIEMIPVTKGVAGDSVIVSMLHDAGFECVAESRVNLIKQRDDLKYMIIKGAHQDELEEIVDKSKVSIQTELSTIKALNKIAISKGVTHHILLMIDWKDGREGVLTYEVAQMIKEIVPLKGIYLKGVAFNFMCFRPLPPSEDDLPYIHHFIDNIEKRMGYRLNTISGGNSSMLTLAMYSDLGRINQLRIGETWLRGYETSYGMRVSQLYEDAFLLEGRIIEIKPRLNIETHQSYMQALVDIGQLDTHIEGLALTDSKLKIVGSTSDIMLIDIGIADYYQLGDRITFKMSYNAIAHSMHVPQLKKCYHKDEGIEALLKGFYRSKVNNFSKQC
ncbi:alanine racemase [Staphylococcus felis]|uniref:Alanine racemase n=1 Tax=Staphylococcus felis TaxID=46127 RepID=A0AAQ0HPX7_9STAP|nr:alanine racemase [Staphylococcus felis]AVP35540.1 alanine racemase [Staphylococcus felis]MBH9581793.1 alanine racemase [Staphylococcus felis]MDM8327041.1 alanine racemase [Staphylococcus felis]MDQ7192695.1 alanine racemase [Staphylococcus felis]PNZ37037.1 alanine racemase [Staphylococcus felis]